MSTFKHYTKITNRIYFHVNLIIYNKIYSNLKKISKEKKRFEE